MLPQEGEGMSEGVAETETPEEVEGRIRQLLAKASYKYEKECSILSWPIRFRVHLWETLYIYMFLIEIQLIGNVALISAVQQSNCYTHVYIL